MDNLELVEIDKNRSTSFHSLSLSFPQGSDSAPSTPVANNSMFYFRKYI